MRVLLQPPLTLRKDSTRSSPLGQTLHTFCTTDETCVTKFSTPTLHTETSLYLAVYIIVVFVSHPKHMESVTARSTVSSVELFYLLLSCTHPRLLDTPADSCVS